MQVPNNRKKLLQRQIPTILGLIILVIALRAGLFFFSDALGVFAPRATPETTPTNVRVSNVSDTGFTVSFLTDDETPGYVKYGTEATNLRSQSGDDRDQLSGSVGSFTLHHITVRGLDPNTMYYYVLGTGTAAEFDDNGTPFEVKTAQRGGTPTAAKTIYGNVLNTTGGPAEGSIVFVASTDMGEMSSLVKSSGSWAVPLSNARTPDGSGYAQVTDSTQVSLLVQGLSQAETSQVMVAVTDAQPVATITLGQNGVAQLATSPSPDTSLVSQSTDTTTATASGSTLTSATTLAEAASSSAAATSAGMLATQLTTTTATPSAEVVDLTEATIPVITTGQPTIVGQAAPNVVVKITVNSDTQIIEEVTASANGEFELDIAQLAAELEPGEHSIQYSYVDPTSGQTITKTKNFTVQPSVQLAQASTGRTTTESPTENQVANQPFGSGNPFPIGGATGSATATASATPTPKPTPTPTATASATTSGRTSQPSTASGVPVSGSVGMTYALVIGGIFFLITGVWSFWVSRQLHGEVDS